MGAAVCEVSAKADHAFQTCLYVSMSMLQALVKRLIAENLSQKPPLNIGKTSVVYERCMYVLCA